MVYSTGKEYIYNQTAREEKEYGITEKEYIGLIKAYRRFSRHQEYQRMTKIAKNVEYIKKYEIII